MDLVEAKQKGYIQTTTRHPWEQARLAFIKKKLFAYANLEKGSVVMDIGCGDVFVSESLALAFPHVIFYAIDTAFTDSLIHSYKSKMRVKNLELYKSLDDATPAKVSVVLLNDVIEHIEEDELFLKSLHTRNYFDNNTLFFITVPAYQIFFCSHDVVLGHYRRYTNTTLDNVLVKSGYRSFRLGYFFTTLLAPRIIKVLFEKISNRRDTQSTTGLTEWKGGKFISWFLKTVLLADIFITELLNKVGIKLPGLSNYALCRKSV